MALQIKHTDAVKPPVVVGDKPYLPIRGGSWPLISGAALLTTVGIFILLPITQLIEALSRGGREVITTEIVVEAPPPPPLDLDPPEPPPPPPPPPEMTPPPPRVSLDAIDASLSIGTGDALGGIAAFDGFGITADDTAGDLSIFEVKDLDSIPRRLTQGVPVTPPQLRRAGVRGRVVLSVIIDERGNVTVEGVDEATVRDFVPAATKFAEEQKFEAPKRRGQAVRVRYQWPINF